MEQLKRPDYVTKILEKVGSAENSENTAVLATYILDLESKQPDRPTRIATILNAITSQYPTDMGLALETYVGKLESHQQTIQPNQKKTPVWDVENPPIWSHQRAEQRRHHRRIRTTQKQIS
jgi:hypothetical protein